MKRSIKDIVLVCAFCGILAAFALLYLILPAEDFSVKEKRVLADAPVFTADAVLDGTFERAVEDYLSDHVPARDALILLNAEYEQLSGRNGLNGVISAGKDRLYAAPASLDKEDIQRKCARINAFAEAVGVPVDVIVIPEAGYMNASTLPALHAEYRDAALFSLLDEYLSPSVRRLDVENALKVLGAETAYYRTDHHLTSRGAYKAARLYADAVGKDLPTEADYEIERVGGFYGSMYNKAGLWNVRPDELEMWLLRKEREITVSFDGGEVYGSLFFPSHLDEADKYPVFLDGNHALVTVRSADGHDGTLLIVRDSFGHCFGTFAADCYDTVVLADLRYYRASLSELAKQINADSVLFLYGADTFMTDTNFGWLK